MNVYFCIIESYIHTTHIFTHIKATKVQKKFLKLKCHEKENFTYQ